MIKSFLTAVVLSLVVLISAEAKTFKLPNDDFAVASITFPDDWDDEEVTNGIGGSSPDGAVYISVVAVGSEKGMEAELDETFEMLKEHNVELDDESKKENKFKINGMDANELLFEAKDGDGPATVSITFVVMKEKIIVMTYWVNSAEEKKHREAVGKIVRSLKAAK